MSDAEEGGRAASMPGLRCAATTLASWCLFPSLCCPSIADHHYIQPTRPCAVSPRWTARGRTGDERISCHPFPAPCLVPV